MIKVLFLVMSAWSGAVDVATADGTQVRSVNVGAGGAADLLNNTHYSPDSGPSKSAFKVTLGCTDAHGNKLGSEDAGYQECLKASQPTTTGQTPQAAGASPSVGFKIGN